MLRALVRRSARPLINFTSRLTRTDKGVCQRLAIDSKISHPVDYVYIYANLNDIYFSVWRDVYTYFLKNVHKNNFYRNILLFVYAG